MNQICGIIYIHGIGVISLGGKKREPSAGFPHEGRIAQPARSCRRLQDTAVMIHFEPVRTVIGVGKFQLFLIRSIRTEIGDHICDKGIAQGK